MFPAWFAGIAFAAIGIGALVPAAIMSIAAANLFTRNIYKEYLRPTRRPPQEAQVSKLASLVVKFGAVAVILLLDPQFSIDLQLIGGVIILQTLPAVAHRAVHAGGSTRGACSPAGPSASRRACACSTTRRTRPPARRTSAAPQYALSNFGLDTKVTLYTGLIAIAVNLIVTFVVTAVVRRWGAGPARPDLARRLRRRRGRSRRQVAGSRRGARAGLTRVSL